MWNPMSDLFRRLTDDVTTRIRDEVTRAVTAASRAAVDRARQSLVPLVVAAAVIGTGVLFLLAGITLALAEWIPAWTAALAVGAVVTAAGLLLWKKNAPSAEAARPPDAGP
jgi:hypothetical protein